MTIDTKYIEVLNELFNISIGQSANLLNKMLNSHIQIFAPKVSVIKYEEVGRILEYHEDHKLSIVKIPYKGGLSGTAKFIIPKDQTLALALSIYPDYRNKYPDYELDAYMELSNILINNLIGVFSDSVDLYLSFSAPEFIEGKKNEVFTEKNNKKEQLYIILTLVFNLNEKEITASFVVCIKDYLSENLSLTLESYVDSMCGD